MHLDGNNSRQPTKDRSAAAIARFLSAELQCATSIISSLVANNTIPFLACKPTTIDERGSCNES